MAWMNESSLYVLVVLSFIILKVNAKQTCVTVQVRAEYFQQSLLESSVYEKRIRSSSSFRSNYNQLSLSAKVSGSFKLFSASAQASYERVTRSVSQFSQNEHTEKSESLTFNSDFLQIVRKITTGVTIGGSTAQTEIRELVDSVDKTKPKTDSQLRKLETDYLRRYFGNDVEIAGHAYTETKCIDVESGIVYKWTSNYEHEPIWKDTGSGGDDDVSIWRPILESGYCLLGDVAVGSFGKPSTPALLVKISEAVATPTGFTQKWRDSESGADWDGSLWAMDAPSGFTCLGGAAKRDYNPPDRNQFCCVKNKYVVAGNLQWTWDDAGSGASSDASVWTVVKGSDASGLEGGNFLPGNGHAKPSGGYLLKGDSVTGVCTGSYQEPASDSGNGKARPQPQTKCVEYEGEVCRHEDGYWGSSWCYIDDEGSNWGAECVTCSASAAALPTQPTAEEIFAAFDVAPVDNIITSKEGVKVMSPGSPVDITEALVQEYIDAVDENGNGAIDVGSEFETFLEKNDWDYNLLVYYHQHPLCIPYDPTSFIHCT